MTPKNNSVTPKPRPKRKPTKKIFNVHCTGCGITCHRTNEKFKKDQVAKGEMFDLLDPWKENGWSDFTKDDYTIGENIRCIECGTPYPASDFKIPDNILSQVVKA